MLIVSCVTIFDTNEIIPDKFESFAEINKLKTYSSMFPFIEF